METEITLSADKTIVQVKTKGTSDAESSKEMFERIMQFMKKHKSTRCLIDHRELGFIRGNTLEIYQRSNDLTKSSIPFTVRIAVVAPAEHAEHFRFLETVCINRFINYRIFSNKPAALDWLKT